MGDVIDSLATSTSSGSTEPAGASAEECQSYEAGAEIGDGLSTITGQDSSDGDYYRRQLADRC